LRKVIEFNLKVGDKVRAKQVVGKISAEEVPTLKVNLEDDPGFFPKSGDEVEFKLKGGESGTGRVERVEPLESGGKAIFIVTGAHTASNVEGVRLKAQ
jgi:hypothetical protein